MYLNLVRGADCGDHVKLGERELQRQAVLGGQRRRLQVARLAIRVHLRFVIPEGLMDMIGRYSVVHGVDTVRLGARASERSVVGSAHGLFRVEIVCLGGGGQQRPCLGE